MPILALRTPSAPRRRPEPLRTQPGRRPPPKRAMLLLPRATSVPYPRPARATSLTVPGPRDSPTDSRPGRRPLPSRPKATTLPTAARVNATSASMPSEPRATTPVALCLATATTYAKARPLASLRQAPPAHLVPAPKRLPLPRLVRVDPAQRDDPTRDDLRLLDHEPERRALPCHACATCRATPRPSPSDEPCPATPLLVSVRRDASGLTGPLRPCLSGCLTRLNSPRHRHRHQCRAASKNSV